MPQSTQTTQNQATPSQTASNDEAPIDTVHVGRSSQVDDAARAVIFGKLAQEQRDAELGIDHSRRRDSCI
jgi:hypothetical protein